MMKLLKDYMTHKEMFEALIRGDELKCKYNGKVLKLDAEGNAILISKNWHNFNPADWEIKKAD